MLQRNSRAGDVWQTYDTDPYGKPEYVNMSGTLYGEYYPSNEILRVCYASYLKRHGMLKNWPNDNELPPVEDGVS